MEVACENDFAVWLFPQSLRNKSRVALSILSAPVIRSSRTLWRKCLFWLTAPGYSPQRRNQGIWVVKQLVLAHPQSGSREQQLHAATLFWPTQLRIPAREWCHLQWAGLPNPVKVVKIFPHRHIQKPISCKILDSAKLTSNSNYQPWILDERPHMFIYTSCYVFFWKYVYPAPPPRINGSILSWMKGLFMSAHTHMKFCFRYIPPYSEAGSLTSHIG